MSAPSPRPTGQPDLAALFGRYLRQRSEDLARAADEPAADEVLPYDAAAAQPVDAGLAWREALRAVELLAGARALEAPADWPSLVAAQDNQSAVFLCAGSYPQLLRSLHVLTHPTNRDRRRPATPPRPAGSPALLAWAESRLAGAVTVGSVAALGVLRLAGDQDRLAAHLQRPKDELGVLEAAWANEAAMAEWAAGRPEAAVESWRHQANSVPVCFNLGVAALFLDRPREATDPLEQAVARLADADPWHHLGRLYLTLAAMRS